MAFHRKKGAFTITHRRNQNSFKFKKRYEEADKKLIIKILGAIGLFVVFVCFTWFYAFILRDLPDVNKIEDIVFEQATTITDRNGIVLYKLYSENRDYVEISKISKNMVNAIIAVEDQRFWTNPGFDVLGMVNAGVSSIAGGNIRGASTITQQLVKNLLLSNERTLTRKVKELVLTLRLKDVIKNQVYQQNPDLDSTTADRKSKEKILEMYLNYIFLGNNSYGVEAASKGYFGTSAQNLTVLQSAILAGIPKSPSQYNPIKNKELVMGEIKVSFNGIPVAVQGALKSAILGKVRDNIVSINLNNRRDNEGFLKFIRGFAAFDMNFDGKNYSVQYIPGRKDVSLTRMFEESYIDQNQLKEAFIEGLDYKFQKAISKIEAPHFVFWIQDLLEKRYDQELLLKGGLVVKTSLDMNIQKIAENSYQKNMKVMNDYGASNSAMIYLDSKNGDVLSYIGSVDYYNEEIRGKDDVVQRLRQPGSSMKPFIYALGFMTLPLTMDSPIFDIPFRVGGNTPNNADGKFEGLLPLRQALPHSRNIPAIKMYFSVGEEEAIKVFMKSLGVNSLSDNVSYGYPLSIGGGEVKMVELANAYAHLSAMGKPAKIDPILEIRLSDGSLLYQKRVEYQKQVIPSGVAYVIRRILSELENLPSSRVGTFRIGGLALAHKSGTTDMKMPDGTLLPRDGRLALYTPSKVAMYRAGNNDSSPMKPNAYGGWVNKGAWRDFFTELVSKGYIKNENVKPIEVGTVSINRINGRVATDDTPKEFTVSSMGYIKTLPTELDTKMSYLAIDKACRGKVSPTTPKDETIEGYLIAPTTIMPNGMDLRDVTERRKRGSAGGTGTDDEKGITYQYPNIFIEEPTEICEDRSMGTGTINIQIAKPEQGGNVSRNFSLRVNASADTKIKLLKVSVNDLEITEKSYNKNSFTDIIDVKLNDSVPNGLNYVSIVAIDDKGFSNKISSEISVIPEDAEPPYLDTEKVNITKTPEGTFQIILLFQDKLSNVDGGKIVEGENTLKSFKNNLAIFTINTLSTVKYVVKDAYGNTNEQLLNLQDYYKE